MTDFHIRASKAELKLLMGSRLAAALRGRGWSAQRLADELGKTVRAVHLWLDGTNMMPTEAVVQAAHLLHVEPGDLLPPVGASRSATPPSG